MITFIFEYFSSSFSLKEKFLEGINTESSKLFFIPNSLDINKNVSFTFVPHVLPIVSGIQSTIYINKEFNEKVRNLNNLYRYHYNNILHSGRSYREKRRLINSLIEHCRRLYTNYVRERDNKIFIKPMKNAIKTLKSNKSERRAARAASTRLLLGR